MAVKLDIHHYGGIAIRINVMRLKKYEKNHCKLKHKILNEMKCQVL